MKERHHFVQVERRKPIRFHPKSDPDLVRLYAANVSDFEYFDRKFRKWIYGSPNSAPLDPTVNSPLHLHSSGVGTVPGMPDFSLNEPEHTRGHMLSSP